VNIPTKIARDIEHEVLMQCVRDIEMCIPYLKCGYETFPVIGDKNVVTEKFFRDAIGYLAFATSEETAEKIFRHLWNGGKLYKRPYKKKGVKKNGI